MSEVVKAPALGISIQSTAGAHQIVFQTHVDQETPKEELDTLTDRWIAVVARQQAKADLVELEKNREVQVTQLTSLRENLSRVDQKLTESAPSDGRRAPRISPHELKSRDDLVAMDKNLVAVLQRFDKQIAETRVIIGE